MKAVRLHPPGGIGDLAYDEIADPSRGESEALVKVCSAALTRDELRWCVDRLPAIPSYELSGVVVDLDPDADGLQVGQAVFGLTAFDREGVAAEYAAVPLTRLITKSEPLSHVTAAAIPLAGLSAMQGLFDWGKLAKGERVLIHGGGGGVGLFAVQLARLAGAHVTVTATGSRGKHAHAFGANEVIDHRSSDFTEIASVDLVFDTAGGDRLARSGTVVAPGGRIVSVAERPPASLSQGSVEASFFIVDPNRDQLTELAALIDRGDVKVLIDSVYPLHNFRAAFTRLQSGKTRGKVVFQISG